MSELLVALVENGVLVEDPGPTPVPWWSFTKCALAAGALALVADGILRLDAPLGDRPFSLRQLLEHRAGLPDYGHLGAYQEAVERREAPWDTKTLLRRVAAERLLFEPGAAWAYSNVGYLFIRQLIEDAVGEPLDDALRRLVLAPLGITGDTRVAATSSDLNATAWGNPHGYDPRWVYHGLLIGPPAAAALLLWRILTADLLPLPLRIEVGKARRLDGPPPPNRPWRAPAYGLGMMVDAATGVIGHTGGGPGSTAAVYCSTARVPTRVAAVFARGEDVERVEHIAATLLA